MTQQPKPRSMRRALLMAAIIAVPAAGTALARRSASADHSPGSRLESGGRGGSACSGHMKDKDRKLQNGKGKLAGSAPGIGAVLVFSSPGPDAKDRLRRLLYLMVRYATRDGQETLEKDSPAKARPTNGPNEAEA